MRRSSVTFAGICRALWPLLGVVGGLAFGWVAFGGAGFAGRASAQGAVAEAVLAAEQERVEAIAAAKATAVSVFASGGNGGGSGVVVTSDGYALTNFHVAKPAGDYMKCSLSDGRLYDAVIVGVDPTGDVAVIKLIGRDDFPHATLGDSDDVQVGDWCFAVGNPFLLATDFQPTVTYGIVSGVHRYQYPAGTLLEYADCIQTDAAINPGNSGGPLFNARGELIGVNGRGSFEKRGRVNVGVGYAISINQIKHFMGCLRSGRIVDHATLGATVATDENGRVVVSNLLETSDAFRRGLRYGDELLSFGGRSIDTVNAFKNVLGTFPKDWRVPLSFRHDGQQYDVTVRLSGVHGREELIQKALGPQPDDPDAPPPPDPDRPPKQEPDQPRPDQPRPDRPRPDRPDGTPPPSKPNPHAVDKVPDAVAGLIKPRAGYANYYFNELNRDRVWSAFQKSGDFTVLSGPWLLEGKIRGGGGVQMVLNDKQVLAQFPQGPAVVQADGNLDTQLDPVGSGGLLVALHLWRRLLLVGPQQYGDLHYLGTFPVPGREGLADVLVATYDVIEETRFLFDPPSGRLLGVEMFPDKNGDACEVYFDDFRDVGGRQFPHRLQIRFGDTLFGEIEIEKVQLPTAPKKEA